MTSVTYDNNGMLTAVRTSNIMMGISRDGLGRKTGMAMNKFNSTGGLMSSDNRIYTGNGHVVSKNAIVMSRFPGGFFDSAGSPYYYLTDFQGNNIGVYDKTGKLVQRTDYYASGEPWLEPEYGNSASGNRYLFGGKERMAGGALNEYDFEARNYVASFQRFTTIDPLTEVTPSISPYAYCNANPVNFTDPFGLYIDYFQAMKDAMFKYHGANVYYDNVQHEYYIALDKYGVDAYRSGGYLTKHFGEDSSVAATGYLSYQSLEFLFGSYLSIQKEINYSEFFGTWKGQNGKIYNGFKGKGPNRYTGSRKKAKIRSNNYGNLSLVLSSISVADSGLEYIKIINDSDLGPNMKAYLKDKICRDGIFNAAGLGNIYMVGASFGYNLGYFIEDTGQLILDNPDFRIRLNPYTLDFTPIEQTLQLYDELGIYVY